MKKKKKMQRQAMMVTIEELRDLADSLEKEAEEIEKILAEGYERSSGFQINIVNHTGASDGWSIEK